MKPFQYATAATPESAVDLLGDDGKLLAGGTDLLGEIKDGIAEPDILVNIKALPGTQAIEPGDDAWRIGANVPVAALAADAGVRAAFPGLARAALEVGSPQIRNAGTLGGNLAQHSRCWYYRHPDVKCLKNRGSTCYAREGKNRHHSIFSGNTCISPVTSNLAVVLTALGAEAEVFRAPDVRRMTMPELYEMAWFNPLAHNSLRSKDLILAVHVPTTATASAYMQVSEKTAFDWALVSCAAAARIDDDGRLRNARVVLGAVAPVPYRSEAADAVLEGRPLTPERADEAAGALLAGAEPLADNGYKVPIARALVRRTLMSLVS